MTQDEEDAKRHNRMATLCASIIIGDAGDDFAHGLVVLESVVLGVVGTFFKDRPDIAKEHLDAMTMAVMERWPRG